MKRSDEMLTFSEKEPIEENLETVPDKVTQNEPPCTLAHCRDKQTKLQRLNRQICSK